MSGIIAWLWAVGYGPWEEKGYGLWAVGSERLPALRFGLDSFERSGLLFMAGNLRAGNLRAGNLRAGNLRAGNLRAGTVNDARTGIWI